MAAAPARTGGPVRPEPAATVMVLRDGPAGLEVLLLERASTTPFVPGAHVFPGGRVDDADRDPAWQQRSLARSPESADVALGLERDGLAYWIAAVRECLEEADLLLAVGAGGEHPGAAALADARAHEDLARACADHDLALPLGAMPYVSHWITPPWSHRRYTTRFFAAALPPGQEPRADDHEVVAAAWFRPGDALAAAADGAIELITPTEANLEILDRFDDVAGALGALGAAERSGMRRIDPRGGVSVVIDPDSCENGEPRDQRGARHG